MNLLEVVSILEQSGMSRSLENISGFAGFEDADLCVWKNDGDLTVTVNDVDYGNVWKCFCNQDLEEVWYLVVLQQFSGKVVSKVFPILDVSVLSFV